MTTFGNWLKIRRKAHGLSQLELAEQVGCSAALIRKIENNERRPSRQIAELIVQLLHSPEDDQVMLIRLARTAVHPLAASLPDPANPIQLLSPLTEREHDILKLMLDDLSDHIIGQRLGLKLSTVRWYVKQIYSKLGIHGRDEAILMAGYLPSTSPSVSSSRPVSSMDYLPAAKSSFVGRHHQIDDLGTLLTQLDVRLLTLLGTGGIGKTRLSLEVGAVIFPSFPDGVYFVSLAALTEPALVAAAIMQALGITEDAGQSATDLLRSYLREKRVLLILDNFEHLLAAAPLVADLLSMARFLKVLVTSREPLHLYGEHEYPVPPLTLPDKQTHAPGTPSEAVTLFVQRAQAVQPDFQLLPHNANTIFEICRQLDGLPLAIELAAARIKLHSPEELLQRLTKRLSTLTNGPRDVPERHHTLQAAIAWSYDLLNAQEKILFTRLGIFVEGWTIEAAEVICCREQSIDVYDGLEALLNKNLIQRTNSTVHEPPRFTMLETIREFACEKLELSGEQPLIAQAHAAFFLEQLRMTLPDAMYEVYTEMQKWSLDTFASDFENVCAAWRWQIGQFKDKLQVSSTLPMFWYWYLLGRWAEGMLLFRWTIEQLEHHYALKNQDQVQCLTIVYERLGVTSWMHGEYDKAEAYLAKAASLATDLGDLNLISNVYRQTGSLRRVQGDYHSAQHYYEKSLDLSRHANNTPMTILALLSLGRVKVRLGAVVEARQFYYEALGLAEQTDNLYEAQKQLVYSYLGILELEQGNFAEAKRLQEIVLHYDVTCKNKWGMANDLNYLGLAYIGLNQYEKASTCLAEAIALSLQIHSEPLLLTSFIGVACLVDAAQQARLLENIIHHPKCTGDILALVQIFHKDFTAGDSLEDKNRLSFYQAAQVYLTNHKLSIPVNTDLRRILQMR